MLDSVFRRYFVITDNKVDTDTPYLHTPTLQYELICDDFWF